MDFIPTPGVLIAFVLASVVLTVTPGPDMAFYLSRTQTRGRRSGLIALVGAVVRLFVHVVLIALSVAWLLLFAPQVFNVLKLTGAFYLLWLAAVAVKTGSAPPGSGPLTEPSDSSPIYISGLGILRLNPKLGLFLLTFLAQFADASHLEPEGKLLFLGLLFVTIGASGSALIILAADRFADTVQGPGRARRLLTYAFAAVMVGFVVRLLVAPA